MFSFNSIRTKLMVPPLFLTVLFLSSLGIILAFNSITGMAMSICIIVVSLVFLFGMKVLIERTIIQRIVEMEALSETLANGDLTAVVTVTGHDEIASLGRAMNKMAGTLAELFETTQSRKTALEVWHKNELWLKNGLIDLNDILRGEHNISALADRALSFLIGYLGGSIGVLYQYDTSDETLQTIATYATPHNKRQNERLQRGEGLAGQAALERKMICIESVPQNYLPISSALGEADPLNIVVLPIMYNERLTGVIEIGSFNKFTDNDFSFLNLAAGGIAIALDVNRSRELVNELLEQSQKQSEELYIQQEELRQTNEELEERTMKLTDSFITWRKQNDGR